MINVWVKCRAEFLNFLNCHHIHKKSTISFPFLNEDSTSNDYRFHAITKNVILTNHRFHFAIPFFLLSKTASRLFHQKVPRRSALIPWNGNAATEPHRQHSLVPDVRPREPDHLADGHQHRLWWSDWVCRSGAKAASPAGFPRTRSHFAASVQRGCRTE